MYDFKVIYKPGRENIADPLSRLSVTEEGKDFEKSNDDLYMYAILDSVAVDVTQIKTAIETDHQLQTLKEAIVSDKWYDLEMKDVIKDFLPFKGHLNLVGDFVVKDHRLVIPIALRDRILELAHEGHPGENAMVARLRDKVWWPGVDKQAKQVVKSCKPCLTVSLPNPPEPMSRRAMPTQPWLDLALDFMGPMPSGDFIMVLIDYFSRYKEVRIMRNITAETTIEVLEPIFVRLGYPLTITLDNGRTFISESFQTYCKSRSIHVNFTAPYWPQANGEVERQNRSLLKRLRISHQLNRNWKDDLNQYLLMYNTTVHSVTGKTPTELLLNKTIRGKIPSLRDVEVGIESPFHSEVLDRDLIQKFRGKEREDVVRRAKESDITVGDTVLLKNVTIRNKLDPTFNPSEFEVLDKTGNRVKVRELETGRMLERNVVHMKKTCRNIHVFNV